ncbi:SEFIR domain-containing protein, partial [Candidatus Latescibacterota bacterium]
MENKNPKLFISYCWSSQEHENWVINLATELCESGVDVILDKWDLKEGNDANVFMEQMVTNPNIKKVVLICDKKYTEKTDNRIGGVGTEAQIISTEIYQKVDQDKFVAVITEKDENGNVYVPTYYKSRIYIDLSDEELYPKNFEQLLRWIFDKPLYIKPDLGEVPSFISEPFSTSLGTTIIYKRVIDAIRNNKSYAYGATIDYFRTFARNLENFRITKEDNNDDFDDKIIKNIEDFLPYRNEAIEVFFGLAQYCNT